MSAKKHGHVQAVPRVGSGVSLASASTDHGHTTSNSSFYSQNDEDDDGQVVVNPQKKAKKPLKKVCFTNHVHCDHSIPRSTSIHTQNLSFRTKDPHVTRKISLYLS